MKECKWYIACPMKKYYEKGVLEKHWIEEYCMGNWGKCIRYEMEEKGKYHADWMLPDRTINNRLRNC